MDAKISEKNLGDRNFHSLIVFFSNTATENKQVSSWET